MGTLMSEDPTVAEAARQQTKFGWRVVMSPWAVLCGVAFSLALLVLLQQYGVTALTNGGLLLFLVIGILLGVFVPTLSRGIAVTMVNHRLDAQSAPPEGAQ
jgi:hypothetical protein